MPAAIACLPWYDFRELQPYSDGLWQRVRAALMDRLAFQLPVQLDRSLRCEDQWQHPELVLGQACGYDAILPWRHALRVVAAPHFDLPGCEGYHYRSHVVVRSGSRCRTLADLRGGSCAINSPTSHSGMNALRTAVAPLAREGKFFSAVEVSGAHETSVAWVGDGRVDVAAVDCVTYALLGRYRPGSIAELRILYTTPLAPAPPFVTRASASDEMVASLRAALATALPDPALGLVGVEPVEVTNYQPIADLEIRARALGYTELPGQ